MITKQYIRIDNINNDNINNSEDTYSDDIILSSSMFNTTYDNNNEGEEHNNKDDDIYDIVDEIELGKDKYYMLLNSVKKDWFKIYIDVCCICGKTFEEHRNSLHKYVNSIKEYKCKKCGLYFYQHKHTSKQCNFTPHKHITPM